MQIVKVLLLCVHVFHTSVLIDGVKLTGNERTFSSAAKGGEILGGIETTLFETGENEGPGYVSQQWYTHLPAHSRVRMYIDGETQASLDFDMYLFHGIGDCVEAETRQTPLWGTKRFGHLASGGGLYNNIRIPFSKSIKVTIEAPSPTNYWYIIRIVFGLPLSINDYELPAGSRLRLYKTEQRLLEPFEFLDAANSEGKAGWVYLVSCHELLMGRSRGEGRGRQRGVCFITETARSLSRRSCMTNLCRFAAVRESLHFTFGKGERWKCPKPHLWRWPLTHFISPSISAPLHITLYLSSSLGHTTWKRILSEHIVGLYWYSRQKRLE